MMNRQALISVCLTMAGTVLALGVHAAPVWAGAPPPNAPAKVRWDARQGKVSLTYHGTVVLDALVWPEYFTY